MTTSNPFPVQLSGGTGTTQNVNVAQIAGTATAVNNGAASNGVLRVTIASDSTGQIKLVQGGAALSATNGIYSNILNGNAVLSASNPLAIRLSVDGTNFMDATHGAYCNILQGNAVLSNTNPLFTTVSGLATASIVNAAADIVTTTSTVVNLGVTSRKITVKNCDTTAVINVDIKAGTASVSNGVRLDPGIAYTFTPAFGASSFSYYSTAPTSATKTLTYVAE